MTNPSKSDTFPHEWIWVDLSTDLPVEHWKCSKCGEVAFTRFNPERGECPREK